jgi:hypothetical protein
MICGWSGKAAPWLIKEQTKKANHAVMAFLLPDCVVLKIDRKRDRVHLHPVPDQKRSYQLANQGKVTTW